MSTDVHRLFTVLSNRPAQSTTFLLITNELKLLPWQEALRVITIRDVSGNCGEGRRTYRYFEYSSYDTVPCTLESLPIIAR